MNQFDPVSLALFLALMSVVPLLIVSCTAFLKISTVLLLVRNVLGVQQIPPNLAIYGIALVISVFVMMPTLRDSFSRVEMDMENLPSSSQVLEQSADFLEPFRVFMNRFAREEQKEAFYQAALAGSASAENKQEVVPNITRNDYLVVVPAFITSELTAAFEIGFMLALPFVIIDLVVSNILLALGMMMVSPNSIALPLKLLLFISVDGWSRLLHGIVLGYQ
ncbi:type III secretion system export apparatus subunit SctR [Limnobacter alexandrii]|jgi:type III secretion protein R|uniref:type III secretion system export apparatus subunit SctR n=1 Tax=Limnobacter alexandrii TaxID=2570352 RepID=UPI00110871E9|nr:type III secretion system export apparatus subunit SctR [Limnobacter alexandrii]